MQVCIDNHQFFLKMSQVESKQWLTRTLGVFKETTINNDLQLFIDKKSICQAGYKQMYGISNKKFYAALNPGHTSQALIVHGNTNNQNALNLTARASMCSWITKFVTEIGEPHPTNNKIYMPKYIFQISLYLMYKNEWIVAGHNTADLPSEKSFRNTVDHYFDHVQFLKKTMLGRCDFCMSIGERKKQLRNELEIQEFKEACAQHRELYTRERLALSNRTELSHNDPDGILHIVFDCPDAFHLPSIVPVTKITGGCKRVSANAIGFINHSSGARDYMFFLEHFKKNPNLVLTSMYLHLLKHFESNVQHPPVLWLQADNCFKENKNRWMMAFCCWLIHIGWFKEVMISMLPKGHTHIDIDQMFSTYSIYMDSHSIETLPELVTKLSHAYKKAETRPTGAFLKTVYNWIGFFAPFSREISGLNSAHVFLFKKLENGSVGMKAKKWHSTDDEWIGSMDDPHNWMKIMPQFPEGFPETVDRNAIEDLPELDEIRKCSLWMKPESISFWEHFLHNDLHDTGLFWETSHDQWNYHKVNSFFLYHF